MLCTQGVEKPYLTADVRMKSVKKEKTAANFEMVLNQESKNKIEDKPSQDTDGGIKEIHEQDTSEDMDDAVKNVMDKQKPTQETSEKKTTSRDSKEQDTLQDAELPEEFAQELVMAANTMLGDIVQLISLYTGKSTEEIQGMMEALNMNPQELMNSEKLNQLTANLMNKTDVMQLLTDSELSGMMKNLTVAVQEQKQEFMEMYQINDTKLKELFMKQQDVQEPVKSQESNVQLEQMMDTKIPEQMQSGETDVKPKEELQDNDSDVIVQQDASFSNEKLQRANDNSGADTSGQQQNMGQTDRMTQKPDEKTDTKGTTMNMTEILEHLQNKVETILPEENREIITERIMRQITDSVRAQATPDMKSLELQLEPANLGRVTISIVSKAGHVTAEIAAQTQVAKEAIESQLAVLKENLLQQGIKIESVEVTIASHGFEGNLEKGNGSGSQNSGNQRQRRRMSTDYFDENNGFVTEDESLEETVLEELGGNISYLA